MSFNVYDYETRTFFDPGKPFEAFGWDFSWTGCDAACNPFTSAAGRDAWVSAVGLHVGNRFEPWQLREVAALLALATWGHEADREFAGDDLRERYGDTMTEDEMDELYELAAQYDPSEDPKGLTQA